MSTVSSGKTNSHDNPDEPRDERGRWTTGGSSWRANPVRRPGPAGRAHLLLGHALTSAWHQGLIREFKLPTEDEAGRFARTLRTWNAASDLDPETFRENFTRGLVDKPATIARLRQAASGSAEARSIGQMVDASRPLTQAIREIGADRWPWVRERLADKAAAAMPAQFAAPVGTTAAVVGTGQTGLAAGNSPQGRGSGSAGEGQSRTPANGGIVLAADTLISKGSPPDGRKHPLHSNPALDGPEAEDGWQPFHTPTDGSSTPEQRKRFYDSLYDRLQAMAKRLDINVEWLLGLAAWESGWLDEHNWPLRNPFGLTDAGGPNLRFNTFRSVVDKWETLYGSRVRGAKTVDEFLNALGPQKDKPDLPAYNSVSQGWRSGVKSCINSQAHFIATWRPGKSI
jgi:hypothetical protein